MIITYRKGSGMYRCVCVIPEGIPWRVEVVAEKGMDGREQTVRYALNLVAGQETLDTLMLSDEYWAPATPADKPGMTLALLNQVARLIADETETVIAGQGLRIDLADIIEDEVAVWHKFQDAWAKGAKEDTTNETRNP